MDLRSGRLRYVADCPMRHARRTSGLLGSARAAAAFDRCKHLKQHIHIHRLHQMRIEAGLRSI